MGSNLLTQAGGRLSGQCWTTCGHGSELGAQRLHGEAVINRLGAARRAHHKMVMASTFAVRLAGQAKAGPANLILHVCDGLLAGPLQDMCPLQVWMTGSGTRFNMAQPSNDTFALALSIATTLTLAQEWWGCAGTLADHEGPDSG